MKSGGGEEAPEPLIGGEAFFSADPDAQSFQVPRWDMFAPRALQVPHWDMFVPPPGATDDASIRRHSEGYRDHVPHWDMFVPPPGATDDASIRRWPAGVVQREVRTFQDTGEPVPAWLLGRLNQGREGGADNSKEAIYSGDVFLGNSERAESRRTA
ncbi:hypothetical protein T484DRAFT_1916838 [Baffinella frigidus]|nr:hypothetical protein T484DRAFT_1916838 [Cryptophyta sp. CCMP2293]